MNIRKSYHIVSVVMLVIMMASSVIQLQAALLSYDHCMNNMPKSDHSQHHVSVMHDEVDVNTKDHKHSADCCMSDNWYPDTHQIIPVHSGDIQIECMCDKSISSGSENAVIVNKLKLPSAPLSVIHYEIYSTNDGNVKPVSLPPFRYFPPLLYLENESLLI